MGCPVCGENIAASAVICRFCQAGIDEGGVWRRPPLQQDPKPLETPAWVTAAERTKSTTGPPWSAILFGAIICLGVFGAWWLYARPKGAPVPFAATHTITGTMTLTDSDNTNLGGTCAGSGGYSDMRSGTQVVVKDSSSRIIAQSSLQTGKPAEGKFAKVECVFPFTINDVPESDFYLVSVGHRGEISHSHKELEQSGWEVGFTLG